jgi:hypothetical protein
METENKTMETENKVVEMTPKTITISRDEFREAVADAVKVVSEKIESDEKKGGMAAFLIPLTGMTFAGEIEDILFGHEEE